MIGMLKIKTASKEFSEKENGEERLYLFVVVSFPLNRLVSPFDNPSQRKFLKYIFLTDSNTRHFVIASLLHIKAGCSSLLLIESYYD